MSSLCLKFDGSCSGQHSKRAHRVACYGWVLLDERGDVLMKSKGRVDGPGVKTNNVAEFVALEKGLAMVAQLYPDRKDLSVICKGDSQLVVEAVNGRWTLRQGPLLVLLRRVKGLVKAIRKLGGDVKVMWIPREQNSEADKLSGFRRNSFPHKKKWG